MEYVKSDFFNVRYNTELNRLEFKKESWTSRLKTRIKEHKIITMAVISFAMFSTLNAIMIYNFMKILQSV